MQKLILSIVTLAAVSFSPLVNAAPQTVDPRMIDPSGYTGLKKPLVCKRGDRELYVSLLPRGRYSVSHDQSRSILDTARGDYIMQGKVFKLVSGKLDKYLISPGTGNRAYTLKDTAGETLQCIMVEKLIYPNTRSQSGR
jgi:hypothetical protein